MRNSSIRESLEKQGQQQWKKSEEKDEIKNKKGINVGGHWDSCLLYISVTKGIKDDFLLLLKAKGCLNCFE